MALFSKKADPISARQRVLNQEIAVLEAQIKKLDTALQGNRTNPNLSDSPFASPDVNPSHSGKARTGEPIFEAIDLNRLKSREESALPEHYNNELGVRKYDLPALFRRIRQHFRGPSTTNPKLVSYLAAGGIQGLRPLRYEKRVARNRFIFLAIFLFLMLLGIITVFIRQH
jgi:hypothetical protein